jgi:hypothetical protein
MSWKTWSAVQDLLVLAMFLDGTVEVVSSSRREAVSMSEVLLDWVVFDLVVSKVSE